MEFLKKELASLKDEGLYRKLTTLEAAQKSRTIIEGKEVILLSSNNYLGLANHLQIKKEVFKTIKEYGTSSGGSRLTTGNYDLHQKLERKLAEFKKTEAALVFNTGYMANLGVLSTVVKKGDVILCDKLNHASIIDGCRLSKAKLWVYKHNNLKDLAKKLKRAQKFNRRLIVTDSVFSMDGDLAPLDKIVALAKKHKALVMVDDAHATGVLGQKGRGSAEYFSLEGEIDIQLGTLSKALAAEGGFVAGKKELIDFLKNKARPFIYSTALAPGTIAAGLASLQYLRKNPEIVDKLKENIRLLKSGLKKQGYNLLTGDSAIAAVIIGNKKKALALSEELFKKGVFAPAIRPPTVAEGASRIRVTLMASHQKEDIKKALAAFAEVGRNLEII